MMADHPPSAMEARTKTVANIRNTMGIVFPIGEEKSLECREHASDMEAAGSRILPFLSNSCSTGFDSGANRRPQNRASK